MPRSFRLYHTQQNLAYYETLKEQTNERRVKSTFSDNLNPDVPEFVPVINGQEENKKNISKEDVDGCVEAIKDKLSLEDEKIKENTNTNDTSGKNE